ncbi:Rhomboid family protein [Spirochaeta thermophila DSM 6578]|uniref:Rhomboid family protein n=1 Tax=Winmispira thermophila (strain ATCC 700085 / DSM 6578 / Z-1203) TaxID=869211 RepID=G0GDQ2_WINT7|nr:rhomboid family intramembrane serine protease [Spirochaeta thermophila]AEJ62182.1 Rhomboid family protein [Spirochaeta thermophila DSM 6578]
MLPIKDTVRSWSFPWVNWGLIVTNVLVFLWMVGLGPEAELVVRRFGLTPAYVVGSGDPGVFVQFLTAMFLHGGWAHLFSNMLALYIFGDNVEDRLGSGRYLIFYLLSGIAASVVHIALFPHSTVPMVGASGAISGVLAAYVLMFPTARVITLIPVFFLPLFVEIPALFYIGGWFVSQLLNGFATIVTGVGAFGGVAWWAHVGGFVAGALMLPAFRARTYRRRVYRDEYFPW